jgi:hypothetical protein
MKKFLAVFIGSPSSPSSAQWEALDEKTRDERESAGKQAWANWMTKHQKSLVVGGSPLGGTKRVGPDGISDIQNALCAFVVVQAETHAAAAELFVGHPHYMLFPGDSIEVMECLPIPGM